METMNTNNAKLALAVAAALALSACSTTKRNFSCPVPDGVKCMSATEVYERTNFSDRVTPRSAPVEMSRRESRRDVDTDVAEAVEKAVVDGPVQPVAYRPYQYAQATPNGNSLAVSAPQASQATAMLGSAISPVTTPHEPHRDAAKILQVWVGAYEDEAGRLHMPTQVFVEIEPRKWSIGHRAQAMNQGFALIEMPGQGAAQDGQERADAGARSR